MSELFLDIGHASFHKFGEELCGDHVEIKRQQEGDAVIVLADGLGSGVKASILSTLTATILSTMIAEELSVEECVNTMTATLPVCGERSIAYSTFSILRIRNFAEVELYQYDNPPAILLRGGNAYGYPIKQEQAGEKLVSKSRFALEPWDTLLLFSDGALYASEGGTLNLGWRQEDIVVLLKKLCTPMRSAKTISTLLLEHIGLLYGGKPGDDTTVCTMRLCRSAPVNLLIGPPENHAEDVSMLFRFFSQSGKHIICGGTTAAIAAQYLKQPLDERCSAQSDDAIPPTSKLRGADLVTEGAITLGQLHVYTEDFLGNNQLYPVWSMHTDGASLLAQALLEEATDLHFFIGRTENAANRNAALLSGFSSKAALLESLMDLLRRAGKRVTVQYF